MAKTRLKEKAAVFTTSEHVLWKTYEEMFTKIVNTAAINENPLEKVARNCCLIECLVKCE